MNFNLVQPLRFFLWWWNLQSRSQPDCGDHGLGNHVLGWTENLAGIVSVVGGPNYICLYRYLACRRFLSAGCGLRSGKTQTPRIHQSRCD